jgi:tetratricopeptide (TPR) repeat protein
METRDLLVLIGFLRGGWMFPCALQERGLPAARSLRILIDAIAREEQALVTGGLEANGRAAAGAGPVRRRSSSSMPAIDPGSLDPVSSKRDIRERAALTAWSGDFIAWTTPISEVPDPGVVLCLLYDGPAADAVLPIDVFAQTLRRYALRDAALRAKFEAHVDAAGTFVPPSLSPELRRARSQQAFDRAMAVAREQGFAAAVPLFEGVRGDSFAPAQIAIAVHELRDLGDAESALARLDEVVRVAPRNVAARMQRAQILMADAGRRIDAAGDWLAVLREIARPDAGDGVADVRDAARGGLWALHREFANARKLEAAATLAKQDPDRGFEAVSRYVHTHPCAWDATVLLASLALARQSFDLVIKLLANVRWLYADDPNPHFVYGQALASKANYEAAVQALEHAQRLAPKDGDIAHWLTFARERLVGASVDDAAAGIEVVHHVARTLFLVVGFVRGGRVLPAAIVLHRVPGDVSLALVLQSLAAQEQRRFGEATTAPPPASGEAEGAPPVSGEAHVRSAGEIDLFAVNERAVLLDSSGARLSADALVGDVPDPGVLYALLYESISRDSKGRPIYTPPPVACKEILGAVARTDTEIAAKLEKHMASPDATLMARLDLSHG